MNRPFQQPPLPPFSDPEVAKGQARAWEACFSTLFPHGVGRHHFQHPENLNGMQTAVAEIQHLQQCEQQLNEWITLTDWIQTAYSSNAHPLLSGIAGKHRAEVLRELAELSLAKGKADVAIGPYDEACSHRFQHICNALGLQGAVPSDCRELWDVRFAVLGMIRLEVTALASASGSTTATAQEQLRIAREALTALACFHDSGANASLKFTGDYSCFDEPSSVRASRAELLQIEALGMGLVASSPQLEARKKELQELQQRVTACLQDPMYCNHAEISKVTLQRLFVFISEELK